jgi:hypothetical protein
MSEKHETIRGERLFYCFVDFQSSDTVRPLVYVMPNDVVAKAIAESHRKWLAAPGKGVRPHTPNKMRRLIPFDKTLQMAGSAYGAGWLDKYLYKWKILGLDTIVSEHTIAEE